MNHRTPHLIGLHGLKRSGKTSIAQHLMHAYGYASYAIADPLRSILTEVNPLTNSSAGVVELSHLVDSLGWDGLKHDPVAEASVRPMMIALGAGLRRSIGPQVLLSGLSTACENTSLPLVISDVRLDTEASVVRAYGGIIVEVVRPGLSEGSDVTEHRLPEHLIDVRVHNDSTLDILHDRIDSILSRSAA